MIFHLVAFSRFRPMRDKTPAAVRQVLFRVLFARLRSAFTHQIGKVQGRDLTNSPPRFDAPASQQIASLPNTRRGSSQTFKCVIGEVQSRLACIAVFKSPCFTGCRFLPVRKGCHEGFQRYIPPVVELPVTGRTAGEMSDAVEKTSSPEDEKL